jgi:hypothetical protein
VNVFEGNIARATSPRSICSIQMRGAEMTSAKPSVINPADSQ